MDGGPMMRTGRRVLTVVAAVVVLLPIVEIWLLILLGRQVGALPVLGLVVLEALIGSWLIRRRWRAAWQSLQPGAGPAEPGGAATGAAPLAAAVDTVLVVAGGVALIFPGLITDLVGLLCLLPFVRRLPRRLLRRWLDRRVAGLQPAFGPLARGASGRADVVEGEVVDDPHDRHRGDGPAIVRGRIDDR